VIGGCLSGGVSTSPAEDFHC